MLNLDKKKEFEELALKIRIETVRAIGTLGFGHVGGAMSVADTIAVLYGGVMNIDPKNPRWEDRDWLVCSKGHAGPSIYSALALKGYFDKEELLTLNKPGTHFPSHCDRNLTTGIDMTTGSLGQGASTALGVALGNRLKGKNSYTYLILGDGEIQEGQVWESVLCAAQQKIDHLIVFVDYNKQQLDGYTKDINDVGDVKAKFESFGWYAQDIDGHDVEEIYNAIEKAKANKGTPSVIVLNTIKGKGCTFAEGILSNHHVTVNEIQMNEALSVLESKLEEVVK
ncbi:transketolase [Clostridium magnum]|uniref:Transketolase 1 n=1 Tax=Clostridium magnum DSM 2767 TaxID=1121326 RepID=A0A161XFY1_9CLOT|nr:transketolase [Clostridium magnum]KZL93466.1 transketolase 1 [Clostridium magnum DSM 2767]SHI27530.1 transketolase [Clostridium magnum DSM 2767]